MYEQLLFSIKKHFNKTTRTSVELKDKLHELFEDNIAEYSKFASWYDPGRPISNVGDKDEFEHYVIEDIKKSMYGDNYAIKEYKPCY